MIFSLRIFHFAKENNTNFMCVCVSVSIWRCRWGIRDWAEILGENLSNKYENKICTKLFLSKSFIRRKNYEMKNSKLSVE